MSRKANFSKYYVINPINGCWDWQLTKLRGYGRVTYKKKVQCAHRLFYKLFVGEIKKGLTLDHLCKNKGCVNPKHLEPVTLRENIRRSGKLNSKKVEDIKILYKSKKFTQKYIASKFGIDQSMVSYIISGKYWYV